ncbi:MAG: DUF92 domain-containing protein, partial [Candidatus Micrarchaeaceae archaeon]
LALLLYFLVLSAIVTAIGKSKKKQAKVFEESRGIKNVASNGGWALVIAILFFIFGSSTNLIIFNVWFAAAVASITSDKFSSEIGVLDGIPVSIISLKKVKKGTSGGITMLGTLSGLFGAFFISLAIIPFSISAINAIELMGIITFGGFIGTISDSILGYFEEKGIGNKHTSNFFCSIIGSTCAAILML